MPVNCVDTSLLNIPQKEFELFRTLIHKHTGIWLREGKQVMLASRLAKRVRAHKLGDFAEYYRFVDGRQDNGVELGELINCVTTNKTAFFRERHHFDFLLKKVPEVVGRAATRGTRRSVSVWSAACSTGEEPYSIAMTLLEARRGRLGDEHRGVRC
jgi:chemotaxis protein methyltransferase CheR